MSVVLTAIKCPMCSDPLSMHATVHGIVWVCGKCCAFGANMAVIRKVAPRQFVKHLWLAATQLAVGSRLHCPSCSQPLREFGDDVEVSPSCKLCTRCFLIWFDAATIGAESVELHGDGEQVFSLAFRAIRQLTGSLVTEDRRPSPPRSGGD